MSRELVAIRADTRLCREPPAVLCMCERQTLGKHRGQFSGSYPQAMSENGLTVTDQSASRGQEGPRGAKRGQEGLSESELCAALQWIPPIHYLYRLTMRGGWGGGGLSQSQLTSCVRWGLPWSGQQSITGSTYRDKQPFSLTITPKGYLESP